ncbi:MAG: FAD-binding oxidoreductase [Candidatus Krumholzibacteriia bacterium]
MTELTAEIKQALTATVAHWRDTDLDDDRILERGRPGVLDLVLEPSTEAELSALVGALRRFRVPTTTIAGRSGLVEAQRPDGVAIAMRRFDQLGDLTLADGTRLAPGGWAALADVDLARRRGARVRVGAGLPIDTINAALAPAGLKLPIVMGSSGSATAGACAANGSAGANAVRYGTAADLAVHVRGVLGTGEVVAQDVPRRDPVTDPARCRIRSDRFSHGDCLVGSQGALGLITEVTYEVVPLARDQAAILLPVADVATASGVLAQLAARFRGTEAAIELFEIIRRQTLERALVHAEQSLREGVGHAPYYALVLVTSEVASAPSAFGSAFVEEVLTAVMTEVRDPAGRLLYEAGNVDFDHDPTRLLRLREACSEMSRLLPKQSYDVVVPLAQLDRLVDRLEAAMATRYPDLQLSVFGHAGVGALHVHAIAPTAAVLAPCRRASMPSCSTWCRSSAAAPGPSTGWAASGPTSGAAARQPPCRRR